MSDEPTEELTLVTDAKARALFGGISRSTAARWEKDPSVMFPPRINIRGRNYRELRALKECHERLKDKSGWHPNYFTPKNESE